MGARHVASPSTDFDRDCRTDSRAQPAIRADTLLRTPSGLLTARRVAAGCLLPALLATSASRGAHGRSRVHGSAHSERALADILPADLDALESAGVLGAVGAQLLLFAGFVRGADDAWTPPDPARPIDSLGARLAAITPTWKGGAIDYAREAPDGIFSAGKSIKPAKPTVRSLARSLSALGLHPSHYDAEARRCVREMLTWNLPPPTTPRHESAPLLLVFSFDATPDCIDVDRCSRPGPTNELLAATAAQWAERIARESGESGGGARRAHVIAQWEVAAAMRARHFDAAKLTPVGTPGVFQNTPEIFAEMRRHIFADGHAPSEAVLLAHPDHLRRALRTARTALRADDALTNGAHITLAPAMAPYSLDWQRGRGDAHAAPGARNLYANVSCHVHTAGERRRATWYDAELGFFPDGEPQRWARSRDVWVLYEGWARAKGVATHMIRPQAIDDA